ncbi:efflux transporter outer membrane subunit [Burkholderia multivorans]|uniref:Fusaric acid resistance protein FusA n=1 Tax=Burkholderia multivorans TaxID=87883 RepID=A0AB37APJ4_9BURK|nr:efflux transporter outer membrane subunit [Burkholderia multivorans]MBU9589653.1 efflux transporter outer membrane subunit [Burkholderia multivorans]PRE39274.1 fusaric acid resistance protein FusA [Burkholderia multivorans]PRE42304.1 fusaric acid resistance protein FusA [Burkholderia multivorans]
MKRLSNPHGRAAAPSIRTRAVCGIAALGALLLGACANTGGIAPRARLIDPVKVANGIPASSSRAAWPRDDWWTGWRDPQLDALVTDAVAGSPAIRVAQARIDRFVELDRIAGASRYPVVSSSGDFSRARFARLASPSPPGGNTVWNNSVGIDLSYALDLWGKHRAEREGTLDSALAAEADEREARLALETAVVRTYITFARAFDQRDVTLGTLKRQQGIVDIIERRSRAGLASPFEVTQAGTPVAATRAQIEELDRQLGVLRNELAVLTGQGPMAGSKLTRPTLRLDTPATLPTNLPAELVGHRPDIVAARWRVEAASMNVRAAKADFYPNIDLIASAGLASAAFGGFFTFVNNDAMTHQFGAAVSLPIFDGGLRQGRYGVAIAEYDLAVETYNQTVLAAFRDVANQVVSLQSLARQQIDIAASVDSARRAFDYAAQGYRAGITDYLNVLSSQTELLQAQQALANVRAARLDAWAQLMMALGGGVEPAGDDIGTSDGVAHVR